MKTSLQIKLSSHQSRSTPLLLSDPAFFSLTLDRISVLRIWYVTMIRDRTGNKAIVIYQFMAILLIRVLRVESTHLQITLTEC